MNVETAPICWICGVRPADIAAHATAKTLKPNRSICAHCNDVATQSYDAAWLALSGYLQKHWSEIVGRGSFDLTKVFAADVATQALRVQLYFVKALGCKLNDDGINVDLRSFSAALMEGAPHAEVTLLVVNSLAAPGKMLSYQSDVSLL